MATSQRAKIAPGVIPQATSAARSARRRALKNFLIAMLFLSPSLIIFLFFVFIPLVKTIDLSTYLTDAIGRPVERTWLENYQRVFSENDLFNSIKVSLLFALYVVPSTVVASLFLAILANVQVKGISVYRIIFSSTIAISGAMTSLIFLFLYNPLNGTLNYLLELVNLPRIPWLVSENTALIAVSIVTVWLTLGFNTVLFLAALQGIPQELYESAMIDGAGFWPSFRHITIPMISPTAFFVIVVSTIGALQTFTQVNVMTRGGPLESTNVIVELLYRAFYFNGQYGIAATLSVVLFLMMLVLTLIQFMIIEPRVHYG